MRCHLVDYYDTWVLTRENLSWDFVVPVKGQYNYDSSATDTS